MKKVVWLFNRLKAMSLKEILYRINKEVIKKIYRFKYKKNIEIKDILNEEVEIKEIDKNLKLIFGEIKNVIIDINESNENIYESFGITNSILEHINWHKGMKADWNRNIYSLDIDTKFSDNIGDIRFSWEINRHQFFPYMALMYYKTHESKYYIMLKEHFYNWNKENYFLRGINWISPMEISIRSYQWLITYYILEDIGEQKFRKDIIKSIIASTEYISKNLSGFSSANNHLIIEAFIVSVIGYACNEVYKQDWFEIGYNILKEEIPKQIYTDGVNKEQALHYQAFVIDSILQYNFILKKINKIPIHENIIKNSLEFMGSLKVNKLNFDFGDSDDAKIISFSLDKINYYKYLLILGSIYYKVKFIEFENILPEVKFISNINKIEEMNLFDYEKVRLYKDGGYLIISNNNNVLLMDVGDLGFGSIAAHGHADALSIIYYHNNNPIFIDSGTYIYNVDIITRDYFRSTVAHNTLNYNGLNQSEIKGPFLWGKRAKVEVDNYYLENGSVILKASHDGYKPYIHQRELQYNLNSNILKIRDYFDNSANVNFILDNCTKVQRIKSNIIEIISGSSHLYVKSNFDIEIEECIISKEFLQKIKSKKIVIKNEFTQCKYIETIISDKI